MMVGGHLNNQMQMAKELKAIHYLLKEQEHLSEQERDNCLFTSLKNMHWDASHLFLIYILEII